jgi:hypothetical protein
MRTGQDKCRRPTPNGRLWRPKGIALRHQIQLTGALYWDHDWILLTYRFLLSSGAFDWQP